MAVQQGKVSKMKCRQRQAANRYRGHPASTCPACGAMRQPHRVCMNCGIYGGKQVVTITSE